MSSTDLILSYIADITFSRLISKDEFQSLLRNGKINPPPTEELIDLWYRSYLRAEEEKISNDKEKLRVFLTSLRRDELRKLEKEQVLESFNIEEIISALYKLNEYFNQMLDSRDKEIESRTQLVKEFNELLNESVEEGEESLLQSIASSLQLIQKYREFMKEKFEE